MNNMVLTVSVRIIVRIEAKNNGKFVSKMGGALLLKVEYVSNLSLIQDTRTYGLCLLCRIHHKSYSSEGLCKRLTYLFGFIDIDIFSYRAEIGRTHNHNR